MSTAPPDSLASPGPTPAAVLVWVLVGALAIRLLLLVGTAAMGPRIADERDYIELATSLVDGRGFAFMSGPTSLRPPLYPAFIASLWEATGTHSLQLVRAAQAVLALVTAWLVYKLGCDLYDARTALVAAAVTAFYPAIMFDNMMALSESLFTILVVAALFALVRLVRAPNLARSAGAGILLGLAALTRSVLWPFPLVLAPLVGWWTPGPVRHRLLIAASLLGGALLTIEGERSWIVGIPPAPPDGGPWTEGKKERWARSEAVRFVLANPGLTLWRSCIKFADFWGLDRDFLAGIQHGMFHPPVWFTVVAGAAMLLAYPVVLACALAGIWLAPPADRRAHVLLLLLVAFVCGLHSVVFGHPRYRLPLTPVLALYAGAACVRLNRATLLDPRRAWPVALAFGAAVAIWTIQLFIRDAAFMSRLLTGSPA
jgi:4-amino-4-deoxy-L-arabinose transferase-like glycosyltransferase